MKKIIAILIAVMLCVFCLSLTAFVAESDEMIPVVVSIPEDWDAPNLWITVYEDLSYDLSYPCRCWSSSLCAKSI